MDLNSTLETLRRALVQTPNNGFLWLQVAEILAQLGRDSEAEEAAREALVHLDEEDGRKRARALVKATPTPSNDAGGAPADDNVLRLVRGGKDDAAPQEAMTLTRESLHFGDVGGLDAVKEEVRMKIIVPFQRPELFRKYGKRIGGGVLLYGPPGCGKTMLARATAGECDAWFMNVTIDSILDMYFGESERKLAGIFETARAKTPAILFFDEIEAIGGSRQQLRNSPGKTLVNQLLAEMDGVSSNNTNVLVMAATNAPWSVDGALRRPGRFDRVLFVPPPDEAARLEILRLHLRERPVAKDVNLGELAKKTVGYSGADLLDLVERAAEAPLIEAIRGGEQRSMTRADFAEALKKSRPSTREWFATAKNYATFANTGGLYDDLLEYLKRQG
ncbi:MAG TPA: ATP-binding protein [Thermoanaerobaculia bacterium]|nr:ATP-binding protein [Thermoanaerobaculia bacterium]